VPYTQLNNLDYLEIKENLKTYMRSKSEFSDYDFEGSALSHILDVLAYNTYYTAFNTNLIANEFFIDSATLRDNVVRIAKQLGYDPKSRVAPKATIDFTTTVTSQNKPSSYTLKKGSGFITNFDNSLYNYVVLDDVTVPVSNGIGYFTNVEVYEGTLVTEYFTYDEAGKNRFILNNPNLDTTSIRINVYPSDQSSSKTAFFQSSNILDIDASSAAYFIEEISDEKYEITFGDGVFGTKLETGNYIEISYLLTDGPTTNGVSNFRFNGILIDTNGAKYPTIVEVTNVTSSDGGSDIETVDNIKFNAPRYFGTQDRAVTAEDFKPIITKIYPNISDIISYGGEDEVPPEYGVVKIIVKPKSGSKLTSSTKREIESQLKKYMVGSVRPVIIDPSVLYVEVVSNIFYSKIKTNLTSRDIETKCIDTLIDYIKKSDVEKFSGKFRYSKVNGVLDSADDSIQSNETSFVMRKDFYPQLNTNSYYEICYQNSFDKDCDGPTVKSTGFVVSQYPTYTVYVKDIAGRMVLYRIGNDGRDIILDDNAGEVDYMKGEVKLYSLTIIKGSFFDNKIELRTVPLKKDIFAFREQYLEVDIEKSTFIASAE
jgi:hypothetical protein